MNFDADPRRWRMLALISAAELLGMSLWFTASAVAPQLQVLWNLNTTEAGLLTTAVQIGFVAGTAVAAALNLADVLPVRAYFAGCALLGAVANAALILAPGYRVALLLRFLTGMFLAGVYPPAMKMAATWFRSARGLAIGTVVGALTVGKAAPYLFRTFEHAGYRGVMLATSGCAMLAAVLVAWKYSEGPFPFERRPFSWKLISTVLRHRETRLATAGYLGHMWELYAMWTWVPAFLTASIQAHAIATNPSTNLNLAVLTDVLAFGAIAAGGLGCLWGGLVADRLGRERTVNIAMAASGLCALGIGLFFGWNPWLVGGIAWVWGFFVVADSAQFSALVTEVAPRYAVGTALTLQTSLGFLLTTVTIQLVPALVTQVGWRWAFPMLALGPAVGIVAIVCLSAISRQSSSPPHLATD
jgi:MFS family permease